MDSVQEIPTMLSRAGSFYYKNLSAEGTLTARKLTQLHTGCRVFSQLGATGELTTSGSYISDYGVLRFSDIDIDYYGTESALQVRPESNILSLKNYTALAYDTNSALAELDREARIKQILAFPDSSSDTGLSQVTLPPSTDFTWIAGSNAAGIGQSASSEIMKQLITAITAPGIGNTDLYGWFGGTGQNYNQAAYNEIVVTSPSSFSFVSRPGLSGEYVVLGVNLPRDVDSLTLKFTSDNKIGYSLWKYDEATDSVLPIIEQEDVSAAGTVNRTYAESVTSGKIFAVWNANPRTSSATAGTTISVSDIEISYTSQSESLVAATRDDLVYGLYVDKNIFVSVIATEQGELLFNGIDFLSFFGLILFKTHPVKLFPKYKFVVPSMTRRCRNLLSFTLGVDDVCGDVSKVMEYYRVSQSPKAFYLAASQAIGMCVVPEDCEILRVEPLHKGFAYITDKGKLDAPYNHVMLMPPYALSKNTVIGGNDLFSAVLPGEELPSDLGSVNLDYLLPVKGLYAPNATVTISVEGKFSPAFEGDDVAKAKYIQFLKDSNDSSTLPDSSVGSANAIDYVRNTLAPRRCLILRINQARMYRDMQMSLDRFIERELPIGVVLLKENMINNF